MLDFITRLIVALTAFRAKIGDKLNALWTDIGNKTNLTTTNKTNLVNAINEVNGRDLVLGNNTGQFRLTPNTTGIRLSSLTLVDKPVADTVPFANNAGFITYTHSTGSTGYPGGLGGGIMFNRNNNDFRGSFELWKRQVTGENKLYVRVGNTQTAFFDMEEIAYVSYVNSVINSINISNYYTKSEALALFVGLTGVQTIDDTKTFSSSPIVPNGTLAGHAVNLGQMQSYITGLDYQTSTQVNTAITTALQPLVEGVRFHHIPSPGVFNVPIESKKTIVNVAQGVLPADIMVDDGLHEGYELAFNGCPEWTVNLIGSFRDSCGNTDGISFSSSKLFWWSEDQNMWIQAI